MLLIDAVGVESEGTHAAAEKLSLLSDSGLLFDAFATGVALSISTLHGFTIDSLCVVFSGTVDLPQATIQCKDGPLTGVL